MIILITAINIIDSYIDIVRELICITSNGGIVYDANFNLFYICVGELYDVLYVHVTVVLFKAYKQSMMDCYS